MANPTNPNQPQDPKQPQVKDPYRQPDEAQRRQQEQQDPGTKRQQGNDANKNPNAGSQR